jgi:hypothetical protein
MWNRVYWSNCTIKRKQNKRTQRNTHFQQTDKSALAEHSLQHDRYQRTVIINNNFKYNSDWQKVKQGVPQGSILGPMLFLLYINDLPYLINKISKPILYADDTTILCSNSNLPEHLATLQTILSKINEWFISNSLSLNLNKTSYLHFSAKLNINTEINIKCDDIQITLAVQNFLD